MPDTRKRVRITTEPVPGHPELRPGTPYVMHVGLDYSYDGGMPIVKLTLAGIDVDLDIEGAPEYLVRVVGPPPPEEEGETKASPPAPAVDVDGLKSAVWKATQDAGAPTAASDAALAVIDERVGQVAS